MAKPDFMVGDIVWAKIRGSPFWPAKIERIYGQKYQMAEVYWLNDYRRTKIFITQMKKFYAHFDEFKSTFSNHLGLETAVEEALIILSR